MDVADVGTERLDFLLLHGGRALRGGIGRGLEYHFGAGVTLLDFYSPGARRRGLVFLLGGVEPAVAYFWDGELPLLFGVEEHADFFAGNDLVASDLLRDVVLGRNGAEVPEVGELGVGDGARRSVAPDIDGKRERFAHLEVCAVKIGGELVVAHHAREVFGLALGGERLYRDVDGGGGGFRLDGFLLDGAAGERHASHLLLFFDYLRLAALGVLELERRNLQVTALGGAQPCELGAGLHLAAAAFDGLEFHVVQVAAVHDKVVASAHVGGLEAALEMFVGMEPERHVELLAFVNRLLARGKAYGEGVVGKGALHVHGNLAADILDLAVDFPGNLAHVKLARLFWGPHLEIVDSRLVAPAAPVKKGVEHVFHAGAHHLVATVEPEEGKPVMGLYLGDTPVFGEFLQGHHQLQAECLPGFDALPVQLEGGAGFKDGN